MFNSKMLSKLSFGLACGGSASAIHWLLFASMKVGLLVAPLCFFAFAVVLAILANAHRGEK